MLQALLASIGHNLRRLADFSGRERQILFWPYAGTVYLLTTLAAIIVTMVPLMNSVVAIFRQIQRAETEGTEPFPLDASGNPKLPLPDLGAITVPIALIDLMMVVLLAAAVARRLHDKDRTALWGLLPLPFLAASLLLMPTTLLGFGSPPVPDLTPFLGMLNNFAYFGCFILLIVLLIGEGTRGDNRFGPDPAAPARPGLQEKRPGEA